MLREWRRLVLRCVARRENSSQPKSHPLAQRHGSGPAGAPGSQRSPLCSPAAGCGAAAAGETRAFCCLSQARELSSLVSQERDGAERLRRQRRLTPSAGGEARGGGEEGETSPAQPAAPALRGQRPPLARCGDSNSDRKMDLDIRSIQID